MHMAVSLQRMHAKDWWHPCDEPVGLVCCPCLTGFYLLRAFARDFCCAIGASSAAEARLKAASASGQQKAAARDEARGACGRCCGLPVGRSAHYFDIDIVADVRAQQACCRVQIKPAWPASAAHAADGPRLAGACLGQPGTPSGAGDANRAPLVPAESWWALLPTQACWQLPLNEGSMHFGRMAGGDASHDSNTQAFFNVKNVPEVFSYFDDFSWELSKLDLKHFRQNAMRNDIVDAARA